MPILLILIVGVIIYFVLEEMGRQYTLKNKKPSEVTPPAAEADAGEVDTGAPAVGETGLSEAASPITEVEVDAPLVETEAPPAMSPASDADAEAPSVEIKPAPEEKTERTPFVDTIPGLTREIKQELQALKLTTSKAIRNASDKKLLAVKGIGPARLKQIRSLCADAKKQ